ncbi:hypothetical protein ACLKA7_016472 [Drosophila subpalustris]
MQIAVKSWENSGPTRHKLHLWQATSCKLPVASYGSRFAYVRSDVSGATGGPRATWSLQHEAAAQLKGAPRKKCTHDRQSTTIEGCTNYNNAAAPEIIMTLAKWQLGQRQPATFVG